MSMRFHLLFISFIFIVVSAAAQEPNYDENKVPDYELPPLLVTSSQQTVKNARTWESQRRPEILRVFEEQMYGVTPQTKVNVEFRVHQFVENAIEGVADLKEVDLIFSNSRGEHSARLLLLLPTNADGPVPVFLG